MNKERTAVHVPADRTEEVQRALQDAKDVGIIVSPAHAEAKPRTRVQLEADERMQAQRAFKKRKRKQPQTVEEILKAMPRRVRRRRIMRDGQAAASTKLR